MRSVVAQLAPTGGTAWQKYLNKRFYIATKLDAAGATLNWNMASGVPDNWKWDGATATLDAPSGVGKPTSPLQKPYFDSATRTYYVYSGEQLKYALEKCRDDYKPIDNPNPPKRTISIQTDIDLNGQAGKVWACVNSLHNVTILGNGHTVSNLRVDDSIESRTAPATNPNWYAAFIGKCIGLNMEHLTFTNANICGSYSAIDLTGDYRHASGIIGFLTVSGNSDTSQILDVTVNNALIVGAGQVGGLSGRTSTTSSNVMTLKNCYAENNICFGEQHVSSLCSSINNIYSAEYCYSIGSVVISTAGHSGGLFSCGSGVNYILNCFADVEVYGSKETGVFAGSMSGMQTQSGTRFLSCFSSGFVEGEMEMGGFIGDMPAYSQAFYDCYSTALVGLRSNGTDIGGFLGSKNTDGAIRRMENCYAAGETGYTGLDCSAGSTVPSGSHIGGMIGSVIDNRVEAMSCCYYDKQTTAMREWGIGVNGTPGFEPTGVLTLDSIQNGNGLTNTNPRGGTTGFVGFTVDTSGRYPAGTVSGALWDYTAGGHYPELTAFKNATAAKWGTQDRANLVKAYSLSSTATAKLDTWDYMLDKGTGKINDPTPDTAKLVYDTVRDLTSSFTLTANLVDSWDRIGEQDSRTHDESTSVIAGEKLDVLSLKAVGGQFICDELVPGIEWLMVTCSVGGQTATRRIRVIPTASLDAGLNAVVTDLYDHADDVKLFYSTGARIEIDRSDVTTGIYPDQDGEVNAITAEQRKMLDNSKNKYPEAQTQIGNDFYFGATANYMGQSGENAATSEIYVYIYKVTGIEEGTNRILTGDGITLTDWNASPGALQFNGRAQLENSDQRYLIEYMWELEDGRVLSDAKMIRRAKLPFRVALHLYQNVISPATLYPTGGYLYTGINKPGGSRLPLTDFSDITTDGLQAATDAGEAEYKETAQTAWKIKNPAEAVTQVQLIMQNGDPAIRAGEVFTKTINNPAPGQTISLPSVEYRIVYRNGDFYTIPEYVTRSYVLEYDAANQTWHLEFDKDDEKSPENIEILFNDVENCITVNVVVRGNADPSATGIPQTGDGTPLHLWLSVMLFALAGWIAVKIASGTAKQKRPRESR